MVETSLAMLMSSWMALAGALRDAGGLQIGGGASRIRPGALRKGLRGRVQKFVLECVPDVAKATFRLATGKWDGPLFSKDKLDALREPRKPKSL